MHIVHVVESFGGGSIMLIIYLAKYLPEHTHTVVYGRRPEEQPPEQTMKKFPDYVQFVHWPYASRNIHPLKDAAALLSLIKIIRPYQDDVVHLHSSKAGFIGRIACRMTGIRKVIYSPQSAAFLRQDVSENKRRFFVWLEKQAAGLSGIVCTTSPSELAAFKQHHIQAVCLPNGTEITTDYRLPQPEQKPLLIVTSGRITAQKNPALFNRIAQNCTDSDVQFVWIGEGRDKHLLTARNITVTGWQKPDEVKQWLQKAHIYLSTALWEGLPFAVLEAANQGKTLLLYDCVGNRDMVSDKWQNGCLFTKADQAVRYIKHWQKNPKELPEKGKGSHLFCKETYNIVHIARQFEKLYKSVKN